MLHQLVDKTPVQFDQFALHQIFEFGVQRFMVRPAAWQFRHNLKFSDGLFERHVSGSSSFAFSTSSAANFRPIAGPIAVHATGLPNSNRTNRDP